MDEKTIFVLTRKGAGEIKNHTHYLPEDVKRALVMVDDKSTVAELLQRLAPSLHAVLLEMLQKLDEEGYIQDRALGASGMAVPKMSVPLMQVESATQDELDFVSAASVPAPRAGFESVKARTGQYNLGRSMIATVLFFDVVGYTRQSVAKQIELKAQFNSLVSQYLVEIEESQRIILDTGDGAAIGFLQHPEDALEVAMQFRQAVTANGHRNYPELKVRMGIHLGPVNIVKDMNGLSNMVGDGINDAQRIMSFAPSDRIYISRAYYDVISRLTEDYSRLFSYRGVQKDKHGREHQVYEVTDGKAETGAQQVTRHEAEAGQVDIKLDPLAFSGGAISRQMSGKTDLSVPESIKPAPEPEPVVQKTAAEIEAEAQAAAEAKAKQEADAARLRAEQELTRLKAGVAAAEMAEAQAKVWAKAEQRAKVQGASVQAGNGEPQAVSPPVQRRARARGKPVPWGKLSATLLVLLLVLVALLPYVWPMQTYIAQFEHRLSAQLKQQVHIGQMQGALLPLPRLELRDVSIGKQELKAGSVVLNFTFSSLFSATQSIDEVAIDDLALDGASFEQALSWLLAAGEEKEYPISHVTLRRMHVNAEGLSLPAMNGEADFDGQGHLVKTAFSSEDGKFEVEIQPRQLRWQVLASIKESHLPTLPDVIFEDLSLKGEADRQGVNFSEIDGHLYGGALAGNGRLNWHNGWQMHGRLSLTGMEMLKAFPSSGIEGEVDGEANFELHGGNLAQLSALPRLDGSFVMKKGVINSVDMVEAVRAASVQSGRTHFDTLEGTLLADRGAQHLRQIRISAGIMNASGFADISPEQQLSGRLAVSLNMGGRADSASLLLSGMLTGPEWRSGR